MESKKGAVKISSLQKDQASAAEKSIVTGVFRLALKNLKDAVQAGVTYIPPRELLILYQLRELIAIDELENTQGYFVQCGACVFDKSCSLFNEGNPCSYKLRNKLESSKDIVSIMIQLLRIEGDRIERSLLIEKKDAGSINREVSAEIMQYFEMVKTLKEVMKEEESITVKVSGKGAISKIFGDLIEKAKVRDKNIEAQAEVKTLDESREQIPVPSFKNQGVMVDDKE